MSLSLAAAQSGLVQRAAKAEVPQHLGRAKRACLAVLFAVAVQPLTPTNDSY